MALLVLSNLFLEHLGFDLDVGKLFPQALGFDAQVLALLLTLANLLFQHHASLDGDVILGFEILEGRRSVAGLALEVIVCDLGIAQLELQGPSRVSQPGDFLFEGVLRCARLALGLSVFPLRGMC